MNHHTLCIKGNSYHWLLPLVLTQVLFHVLAEHLLVVLYLCITCCLTILVYAIFRHSKIQQLHLLTDGKNDVVTISNDSTVLTFLLTDRVAIGHGFLIFYPPFDVRRILHPCWYFLPAFMFDQRTYRTLIRNSLWLNKNRKR